MTLEVCAGSLASAKAAAEGGAERIEMCVDLHKDGLSPDSFIISKACQMEGLKVHVLVRPREGNFVYSEEEFAEMTDTIIAARTLGADGIVIGALTPEGDVDVPHCRQLIAEAQGLSVTFHRAFDCCRDPQRALEDIISLGCDRLLTSGQAPTAEAGIPLLRQLVKQAAGRITIMPGAGVNAGNAVRILKETGATEIHSSARRLSSEPDTDPEVVREILQSLHSHL